MSSHFLPLLISVVVLALFAASAAEEAWVSTVAELPYTMEDGSPAPDRNGKPAVAKDGKPVLCKMELLLPPGVKVIRGILIGGSTWTRNAPVRTALAEERLGLLYYGNPDGLFYYVTNRSGPRLERDLKALAEKSGHPEVAFAPWMTIGYSTSGITCRNIAYWNPDRIIGVMHMMSGNFQAHLQDMRASLAGVPFLVGNGECEQYGPDGGDLGAGHRALYSLEPADKKKNNQTQWLMVRMQLLERRRRNENNLMGVVVQHTLGNSQDHTQHSPAIYPLLAQFIHSAAAARIPKGDPDGKTPVKCLPLTAKDGWLCDADIKNPKFPPAPYAEYKGDKKLAFWYPDKALAEAVTAYHAQPWAFPDPTASFPPEQRYWVVEPGLRDIIDLPEPPALTWPGGDGAWSDTGGGWTEVGHAVPWAADRQACFQGEGGTVTLAGPLSANGLQLGAGYTLALSKHRLTCTWHAAIQPTSALAVTLEPEDNKSDKAVRLQVAGNLDLAGTLVITAEGDLPDGDYRIVRYGGKFTGSFTKVVPPAGYTATAKGGVVTLKKGE